MDKKVLILSGSPRKGGNSDLLCDEMMRGVQESGNQVEKFGFEKRISVTVTPAISAKITMANAQSKMIW